MECYSGVKTTQNSKVEGGIERKKHENVKLKKEDVKMCLGQFYLDRKKKKRMHRETASCM